MEGQEGLSWVEVEEEGEEEAFSWEEEDGLAPA